MTRTLICLASSWLVFCAGPVTGQILTPVSTPRSPDASSNIIATEQPTIYGPRPVVVEDSGQRHIGLGVNVAIGGLGVDFAALVQRHLNVRLGGQFFGYAGSFQEQGAIVNGNIRLGGGRGSLDWFPFHNGFHLSPSVFFLNQTAIRATVLVPSGSDVSVGGGDYVSSNADPLHGSASIGLRKTSPGFVLGYGNLIPRGEKRFSFPVEVGFYYVGQPTLKVLFSGSACDPTQPQPLGCQPVNQDAGFQASLAAFIARNNNNLKYASFLPVLSFGVGYSF